MRKSYIIASATLGALLVASPAYADQGDRKEGYLDIDLGGITRIFDRKDSDEHKRSPENKVRKDDTDDRGERKDRKVTASSSVTIHGTVSAINGTMIILAGKNGASYTVNAAGATMDAGSLSDIRVGDPLKVKGALEGAVIVASRLTDREIPRREFLAKLSDLRVGIVTAVTPTGFTISRFGAGTTTVSTNASTTIKAPGKNGTSTIAVGTKVIVAGATSTADSLSANFVLVLNKGLGWVKHWFER